jgi:hypothetical protein
MAFVNVAEYELQKTVLALLMQEPDLRNEMVRRYPGKVFEFFSSQDAKFILKSIFVADGIAIPSVILKDNPDLSDSEDWNPQKIFDSISFDSGFAFWDHVERLRQISKQRKLHDTLSLAIERLLISDINKIDVTARQISESVQKIASDTSHEFDPLIKRAGEKLKAAKLAGETGRRISSGIPQLDLSLDGGFQFDPGELVVVSGFEKQRKTTLINNIVLNAFRKKEIDCSMVWVCNEGSVSSEQATADLWAMEATRLALIRDQKWRHPSGELKPFHFTRNQMMTQNFTGPVTESIEEAFEWVTNLPIRMYFAGLDDGNSRDFQGVLAKTAADIEFNDAKIVVMDNLQGWRESHEKDYEVMMRVVPPIDDLAAKYKVLLFAVSQYNTGGTSRGGNDISGKANLGIGTVYDQDNTPDRLGIESRFVRNRPSFKIDVPIIPSCGLITEGL